MHQQVLLINQEELKKILQEQITFAVKHLTVQTNSSTPTESLVSNKEFCKKLGISTRTAQNWRDQRIISFTQVGSKIFYSSKDVEEFISAHKVNRFQP